MPPFGHIARRYDVGMTGKTQHGGRRAASCPQVGNVAELQGFTAETHVLQTLGQHALTAGIIRCNRRATNQVAQKFDFGQFHYVSHYLRTSSNYMKNRNK